MTRIPGDDADRIHIQEMELSLRIGVPEAERAQPQRLTISVTFWQRAGFSSMTDQLEKTVDYAAVCAEIKEFAGGRADKLIEVLAEAIARHLLEMFPLRRVRLELRKFILPDVKYVSVSLTRERASAL